MAEEKFAQEAKFFEENGYVVVRNFAGGAECEEMMERMKELVEGWYEKRKEEEVHVFSTEKGNPKQAGDKYFLESANKIHFFLENNAVDEATGKLRDDLEPIECLNKVGHGLHTQDEVFKKYSESTKVKELISKIGYKNPSLPQSMFIFKNKRIGAEVNSHQDSSFLFTEPRQTCLGLWLALEDATEDNGCLWCRPGSHKEPLRRQFTRNPKYFIENDLSSPLMVFRDNNTTDAPWEGGMPPSLKEAGFISAPMKQGDLFVIHGLLDHLSLANTSEKGRQTFQLHLVEGEKEGVTWSKENWLQYPEGEKFMEL